MFFFFGWVILSQPTLYTPKYPYIHPHIYLVDGDESVGVVRGAQHSYPGVEGKEVVERSLLIGGGEELYEGKEVVERRWRRGGEKLERRWRGSVEEVERRGGGEAVERWRRGAGGLGDLSSQEASLSAERTRRPELAAILGRCQLQGLQGGRAQGSFQVF